MKVIVVAGTHSGAGSTTVSISVMNCLRKQGLRVQAFKFGPGFRDNDLFEAATGRMAVNLDPWNVPRDCLLSCVHRYGAECDVAIVDGSAGLFDRRSESDEWSTAELARLLSAPVILVVDAAPMRQSCAAVVKGFETFDKKVKLMGVVLNRVMNADHAALLTKTFDKVGVKAQSCGFLLANDQIVSFMESPKTPKNGWRTSMEPLLEDLSRIAQDLNTSKFIEIATTAKVPKCPDDVTSLASQDSIKIAIAKDAAFSFYYHENFMMLERAGAELVFFSPLEDDRLPRDVAGIYLGGGHPELHAARLAENTSLMASIRAFASAGGVIYAEGGGLLYLSRSIENPNEFPPHNLVGVFPFRTRMSDAPPEDSGYVSVEILNGCPVFSAGLQAKGHICHGSHVVQEIVRSAWGSIEGSEQSEFDYTYRLTGEISHGITKEGYTRNSVLASYVHLQFASNQRLAPAFVERCKRVNLTKVQEAVNRGLMKLTAMDTASRRAMLAKRMSSLDSGMSRDTIEWGLKSTRFSEEISKQNYRKSLSRPPESPLKPRKSDQRVSVYSCEMPLIEDLPNAAEAFGKTQPKKRRELRKSFSLEDVGTASNDPGRHSGNAKIVGMSTTGVEMICALGLENRLVGVTNLCNFPTDIQSGRAVVARTKFEASHLDDSRLELKLKDFWCRQESAFEIDEDFLRMEQPALVIVEDGGDPDKSKVEKIFKMRRGSFTGLCPTSPTTILSHKCRHLSEILEFMLRIAQAAGVEDASAIIVDQLRARVAKIGTLVATDFPVEKVVVLTCLNPLMIGGYWIPEMVSLAGGEPLGTRAGHAPQRVTWQELKAMEPEVMILAAASWDETKQELAQLASLPGWWGLPAMKTGQLYVCDPKLFSMGGPRLIDGIELLARILHPSSAGQYGKQGMAWSCTLRAGKRCRPCYLYRQFCTLL